MHPRVIPFVVVLALAGAASAQRAKPSEAAKTFTLDSVAPAPKPAPEASPAPTPTPDAAPIPTPAPDAATPPAPMPDASGASPTAPGVAPAADAAVAAPMTDGPLPSPALPMPVLPESAAVATPAPPLESSAPAPAPPPDTPPPARGVFTLDSPIQDLIADPGAKAVLDKDLPGISDDENLDKFKALSLRSFQPMTGGQMTDAMLAKMASDLDVLGGGSGMVAAPVKVGNAKRRQDESR